MKHAFFKKYRHQKRLRQVENVLPDAFMMIANAMKAGLSLPQALQAASEDGPYPLNDELKIILEQMKLGHTLDDALSMADKRLGLADFSLMVHSILILRQIGGNLVSHFENLSTILRERQRVSLKVGLLTTQGMTQGFILSLLAPSLALALAILSPDYIAPLLKTQLGLVTVVVMILLDGLGWFWMKHLAKVEV